LSLYGTSLQGRVVNQFNAREKKWEKRKKETKKRAKAPFYFAQKP
jgi:hypothetical protein